jgi:two-component system, NarL family, response regulator YdfI
VIRVFIVAESSTVRVGLENLLTGASSSGRDSKSRASRADAPVAIVGSAPNLEALEGRELAGGIDALLIDASGDGAPELLAQLRDAETAADLPVVLLADRLAPSWSAEALRDGIRAILPIDVAAEQLLAALQAAAAGLVVLHPSEVEATLAHEASAGISPMPERTTALTEPLTRREREVLQMLAAGLGNKEIAARLDISDHTAKFHVASILAKLGAATRTEAVAVGIRLGLILL